MVAGRTMTTVSRQSNSLVDSARLTRRVIKASGFDTTLDITGQLFAKNQILSAERARRAQKRDDQPQEVPGYSGDRSRQVQHAFIMPESARGCRLWTREQPRRELLRTTGHNELLAPGGDLVGVHAVP